MRNTSDNKSIKNKQMKNMVKKTKILVPLFLLIFVLGTFQACKKYDGDSYNFSDAQKHYMIFRDTTTKLSFSGTTAKNVTLVTRVWFAEPLNVVINITSSGGATQKLDVVYDAFGGTTASKVVPVTIPASLFPAGVDAITGNITLVSATGSKYGALQMGYPVLGQGVNISFSAKK